MSKYVLKAVNDEASTCEVCGKVELKRVAWIAELDEDGIEGEPFAAGVVCAAKLLAQKGIDRKRVNDAVKNFDAYRHKAILAKERAHPRYAELAQRENAMLERMNRERIPFSERVNDPEWAEVEALRREIRQWAEANAKVIIE